MRHFLIRHQPSVPPLKWLLAGLGGLIAIGLTGALTTYSGTLFLMAPFGASCVLLFSVPNSPLSQPMNVVFGHLLSTAIGLGIAYLFPDIWWAAALGVGLAIAAMAALRITHPPAGADPLVVLSSSPELSYLVFPVLLGTLIMVATATIFHRLAGTEYPLKGN